MTKHQLFSLPNKMKAQGLKFKGKFFKLNFFLHNESFLG
jgi:hypothetical protein